MWRLSNAWVSLRARAWLCCLSILATCASPPPPPSPLPLPPVFGLDERPANTSCLAPPRPRTPISVVRAFSNLQFRDPIQMAQTADGAWWYLIERAGRVWRFAADPNVTQAELVLDLSLDVDSSGGGNGLLAVALHPAFTTNGQLFLSYTRYSATSLMESRLSRFTSLDGGASFQAATEQVLISIDQATDIHVNTDLKFGSDGYLYAGFGDGAPQGDLDRYAQDPGDLKGKILRLDVDGPNQPYSIPPDNPFANQGGAPEVWALGLRNPWRFTFDRQTGDLWAGDVGFGTWEEIDRIVAGGNYGWSFNEGAHCTAADPCGLPGLIDPVVEIFHDEGNSITAGFVYRGHEIPALSGHLVFGDFVTGYLWEIDPTEPAPQKRVISAEGHAVASFAEDLDGEQYLVDLVKGSIWRLSPSNLPADAPLDIASSLVATGCFDAAGEPAPGLIPYDLNWSFWSDGARKRRWMAVPDGGKIAIDPEGDFVFPNGTVLLKEFALDGYRVETRLLVRHEDGEWAGYTYIWNQDQTDAKLQPLTTKAIVQWGFHYWEYPRRTECMRCHNAAAGRTVGPELAQLDREIEYPNGRVSNQLATLEHIGMFEAPLPTELPSLAFIGDGTASITDRARSWLHANCAGCHRPGSMAIGDMDFRFSTPLASMNICEVPPERGDLGLQDARRLAPGAPERSVMLARIRHRGFEAMPPSGFVTDEGNAKLVEAWIRSLTSCQ
ncbi:MAG: Glutamate synthase large chain [Deltaproteobacteria bacterium]|nr:Glutamate synthase large chain [Deltaproteobacteria bacterium]